MTTTVVHCKREPYDVYIGRPSKWGNPFSHLEESAARYRVVTRDDAVQAYYEWIVGERLDLLDQLDELRDKILGCWCHPQACHGDILAKLADGYFDAKDT